MEETLVPRSDIVARILEFAGSDLIKVITGMRRTGKSTILQLVRESLVKDGAAPESIINISFEDYATRPLRNPDTLHSHLVEAIAAMPAKLQPRIFLDEIQEVPEFERVVNSLRTVHGADIYLTGSNSSLLSGELATLLAGRYVTFAVHPFSFREFSHAQRHRGATPSFNSYLEQGGMPYIATHTLGAEARATYLRDVFNSVMLKDLIARHAIRSPGLLETVLAFVVEQAGNTVSANSIAKYLRSTGIKVSTQTVLDYLSYAEEAFLVHPIRRTDATGKRLLERRGKLYCADHGLRQAITGDGLAQIQGVLENVIYFELVRRGYTVAVGTAPNGQEIDFVATKDQTKRYVQVTYLMESPATEQREFGALASIRDNHPKTVVSLDPILRPRDGIEHRRIDEFLLSEDW